MQFFLDTANIKDIKKYAAWGIVDGVTTNPSLIAKEGVSLEKRIREIAEVVNGPISSEVIATDAKNMIKEGKEYSKWHKNIYVKVPLTPDGLQACKALSSEGINTNVTLVFSMPQAIMAAKAGATLVSPFLGRIDDISYDSMSVLEQIVIAYDNYQFETKVLAASIRHPKHILEAALIGADIATMPPAIFDKLVKHPLTDSGIERFLSDWKNSKAKK